MENLERKVETVIDFILWGSKVTVDGDCSHKIKTLAPWRKSYDEPIKHIKHFSGTSFFSHRSI